MQATELTKPTWFDRLTRRTRPGITPRCFVIMLVGIVTTGCSSEGPTVPAVSDIRRSPALWQLAAATFTPAPTVDEEFAAIARDQVPGFAGYIFDGDSTIVLLRRGGDQSAARQLGSRVHAKVRPNGGLGGIGVRDVDYDFTELSEWYNQLFSALEPHANSVVFDIDEARNRVRIGYEDPSLAAVIQRAIDDSGVPRVAVFTERIRLPTPRDDVRYHFDVMWGGIKIEAVGVTPCTLGFNAIWNGTPVAVTATHCTTTTRGLDYGAVHQPMESVNRRIGAEVWDRSWYACAGGWSICRWSESALIGYDQGTQYTMGAVAWPFTSTSGGWGAVYGGPSTTDVGSPPNSWPITAVFRGSYPSYSPGVGIAVGKMGITTGATRGTVTQTCVTMSGYRCMTVADVWSWYGDSGAGFLVLTGPSPSSGARIAGTLYGGPPDDSSTTYFSTLSGLERDLGATLTVCDPSFGC